MKKLQIKPFKGLMYNASGREFSSLVSPPYDVLSEKDVDRLYNLNPFNSVRLDFGKTKKSDDACNNRYTRSAETLRKWLGSGALIEEKSPCYYVYSQEYAYKGAKYIRKGVIADLALEEFSSRLVLPHEHTLSKPKQDRLSLMTETGSNYSQILCIALDRERKLKRIIEKAVSEKPFISFKYVDGIKNTLWKISDSRKQKEISEALSGDRLLIADGHHRYETSLFYKKEMRKKHGASGPWDYAPVYIVSSADNGLLMLPTHRLVSFSSAGAGKNMLEAVGTDFRAEKISFTRAGKASSIREIIVVLEKEAYRLNPVDKKTGALFPTVIAENFILMDKNLKTRNLKVAATRDQGSRRLQPALNLKKINTEYRVEYIKDSKEVINRVKSGKGLTAGLIIPFSDIKKVFEIALRGSRLPEKSTYFYPKILSGLVMRRIIGK